MKFNLKKRKFAILGIQGSGKTELAKFITRSFKKSIVYTPHGGEWTKEKATIFKTKKFRADFNRFCMFLKKTPYKLVTVDEADMIFRHWADVKPAVNDLVINHRHKPWNLALGFVSRRPQDIPTKILESCHYLFCFSLEGANAVKKLNQVSRGFGDKVSELPFESYKYYVKKIGEKPKLREPVDIEPE